MSPPTQPNPLRGLLGPTTIFYAKYQIQNHSDCQHANVPNGMGCLISHSIWLCAYWCCHGSKLCSNATTFLGLVLRGLLEFEIVASLGFNFFEGVEGRQEWMKNEWRPSDRPWSLWHHIALTAHPLQCTDQWPLHALLSDFTNEHFAQDRMSSWVGNPFHIIRPWEGNLSLQILDIKSSFSISIRKLRRRGTPI